ncbi:MAG: redoxin domain-containing protein [Taibaiella sp.]|nr:redoxin domain-containing protein [Taibaiella sp.]
MRGKINIDTGTIVLISVADNTYYQQKGVMSTAILNGEFSFTDSAIYPAPYRLGSRLNSQWQYLSDIFYIDPCEQQIYCKSDSITDIPLILNKSMKEWESLKKYTREVDLEFDINDDKRDSLNKIYNHNLPYNFLNDLQSKEEYLENRKHRLLIEYAKHHPNSYVLLWQIILKLSKGYKPYMDSTFNQLSYSVKHSLVGRAYRERADDAKKLSIGKIFPLISLENMAGTKVRFPPVNVHSKYTLIDFWFSGCSPCKRQFPLYKKLYEQHQRTDFEILGISVDNEQQLAEWKKVIQDQLLTWPQYLDKDGIIANRFSIITFPTNFLLDKNGVIIMENIKPGELEKILSQ